VNRSCFLTLAACRTPFNPWDTRSPLCVGLVLGCAMFSLVRALPSPASVENCSPLFGSSVLRRSPTPPERARPHYSFSLSRTGLVPGWSETFWRSPGSRACCFSACAGSLTTQGRRATRDLSQSAVLLSPGRDGVSALLNVFSKLNSPAHRYPYLRFERNLTASPARLRAKMESLSPFL